MAWRGAGGSGRGAALVLVGVVGRQATQLIGVGCLRE